MKRYGVRWRPGARMDYEQAMQWVAERSPAGAKYLRNEVRERLKYLAAFPRSAPVSAARGSRQAVVRSYLIFYTVEEGFIRIVDFRHGARDY